MDKQDFKGIIPFKTAEDYNSWRAGTFTKGGEDFPAYSRNILAVLPDEQSQYVETGIEERVEQLEANAGGKLYKHHIFIAGENTVNQNYYSHEFVIYETFGDSYNMSKYSKLMERLIGVMGYCHINAGMNSYPVTINQQEQFMLFKNNAFEIINRGDMDRYFSISDDVTELN